MTRGAALPTIIAIALVSAIGGIPFNTMPVLLGSLGESLKLSDEALGVLGSSAFFGYLAGTLTCPFWVDRAPWKTASLAIAGLSALAFVVSAYTSGFGLNASWAGFGFFCALLHGLGMRMLADQPDKELAYGMRTGVELSTIAVLLMLLPSLAIARAGYEGAAWMMAGFVLLLGAASFALPPRSRETLIGAPAASLWHAPSAGWAALGLFFVYLAGNIGLWIFLGRISEAFEPSPEQTGALFSVLKIIGGGSVLAGAFLGARLGLRMPHLYCLGLVALGLAILTTASNFWTFAIGAWIWEAGFALGCLYQTAAIARIDPTNKLVVLVTTAFALSSTIGSTAAGYALAGAGPVGLYAFAGLCSVLAALAFYAVLPTDDSAGPVGAAAA